MPKRRELSRYIQHRQPRDAHRRCGREQRVQERQILIMAPRHQQQTRPHRYEQQERRREQHRRRRLTRQKRYAQRRNLIRRDYHQYRRQHIRMTQPRRPVHIHHIRPYRAHIRHLPQPHLALPYQPRQKTVHLHATKEHNQVRVQRQQRTTRTSRRRKPYLPHYVPYRHNRRQYRQRVDRITHPRAKSLHQQEQPILYRPYPVSQILRYYA